MNGTHALKKVIFKIVGFPETIFDQFRDASMVFAVKSAK